MLWSGGGPWGHRHGGQGKGGTARGPAGTLGAASSHPLSFLPLPLCLPGLKPLLPQVGEWAALGGARGTGRDQLVTAELMLGRLYSAAELLHRAGPCLCSSYYERDAWCPTCARSAAWDAVVVIFLLMLNGGSHTKCSTKIFMQSNSILFAKLASAVTAVDVIFQAAKVQVRNKLSWEWGGGGLGISKTVINGSGEERSQHLLASLQPCLKHWD